MPIFHEFPYGNMHDQNYDWILKVVKDFFDKYNNVESLIQQAVDAINEGKTEALGEIDVALTAAINDITSSQASALNAISDSKDSALASITTALGNATDAISTLSTTAQTQITNLKNTSISEIATAQGTAISAITASQNHATTIIEQLYNTLPASAQDILGKLAILDNIITGNTMGSFTWLQGNYIYSAGETAPTPPAINVNGANYNQIISSRYMEGCSGRRIRIITDGTVYINMVGTWRNTPPGGSPGGFLPDINPGVTNTYADITFDINDGFTAFYIELRKPDWGTLTPADIPGHIEIQWITDFVSQRIIAPKESSTTADIAREEGEYFFLDGDLYVATDDIAVGDTITEGTNCVKKTVGGELSELKSAINAERDINSAGIWKREVIGDGTGATQIGTTRKVFESSITRITTDPIIKTDNISTLTITPASGYKFYLFFFNSALTSVTLDTGWLTTAKTYAPDNGYMAICFAKSDDSTIDTTVYENIEIVADTNGERIDEIEANIESADADIEKIESVLNDNTYYNTNPSLWGRYVIAHNPGSEQIGTTGKAFEPSTTRISLCPVISTETAISITISPDNGYKFYFFAFDEGLTSVVIDSGWKTAEETFEIYSGIGYFSVVVATINNDTIYPEDCANCAVYANVFGGAIIDLNNRVTQLENPLPAYWSAYFDTKAQELTNADMNLGFDGASFAFVTDVHIDTNNKMSPELLKYITTHTNVRNVVCGGDIVTNYNTKSHALSELRWWAQNTSTLLIVNLHGNHDGNSNNQTDNTQIITDAEFYGLCCRQSEKLVTWEHNKLYGYSDNENQKMRFIYLDTGAPDSAVIDSTQIEWMKARINELAAGWFVVVFCHQFWTGVNKTNPTLQLDGNGTAILNALESIYDNANATICGVIVGHCHRNYSLVSNKGFPVIATTCDTSGTGASTYDPDTPNRTKGSTTEQAFDLFYVNTSARTINTIRIGAGDTAQNRSYTF